MKAYLSKSQFMRGLQCHKSLWLYKYSPELMAPPDETRQAIFDAGQDVGLLARGLFPGGEEIVFDEGTFDEKVERTARLIESGVKTIYEATFRFDDVLVMADILHKGGNGWELYEVKSSADVKDIYLNDLSLQYYVLKGRGLRITKSSIVHINNKYVRKGDLELNKLFSIADLTDEVRKNQSFIKKELSGLREMIGAECPTMDIGPHCESPYECDFAGHCWAHIDVIADAYGGTVFDLRGRGIDKLDYYRRGVVKFSDLNLSELNEGQRMQVEAELSGKEVVNVDEIRRFLDTLRYPLYFLDFETFMAAVPPFDGTRAYEQIPFQYSLHYQEGPEAELKHAEFLAEAGVDGREAIAKNLADAIPANACVVAYKKDFERFVLEGLAEKFPQHAKNLMDISVNLVDLMEPFRKRFYYTKEMKGRYSLKDVLPALFPDLTYEGMDISNAGDASVSYSGLHFVEDKDEVKKIRKALLEYCKLDTFAMVKLIEKLREAAK